MVNSSQTKTSATGWLLALAFAVGTVTALLQLCLSVDMYRDSANVYAFMARALANGEYSEAFHPGIPMLNVLLSRPFTALGMRPEQALSAVSALFYIGTIPLLYLLLKRFMPELPAAAGALFFACAPKIIRFSCTALIDSGKIFFFVAGLYFSCRMIGEKFRSHATALWFGVVLGGMSLARSEGFGNAGMLFVCTALFHLAEAKKGERPPLAPWFTAVAAWILVAAVRVWVNWRFCGECVFDLRIHNHLSKALAGLAGNAPAPVPGQAPARASGGVTWWDLIQNSVAGSYEVYLVLAGIGLVLLLPAALGGKWHLLWPDRKVPEYFRWRPFFGLLLVCVFGNMLLFKLSGIGAYRYFLPNIPLLMIFTMLGICWLWSWAEKLLPRPWLYAVPAALAALLAYQVSNGVENMFSRKSWRVLASGREVGSIMRRTNAGNRVLFSPHASVEWYHSGMRRAVPVETKIPDFRSFRDCDFVLVSPDSEPERLEAVAGRKDLEELPVSEKCTVKLFRKIEERRP